MSLGRHPSSLRDTSVNNTGSFFFFFWQIQYWLWPWFYLPLYFLKGSLLQFVLVPSKISRKPWMMENATRTMFICLLFVCNLLMFFLFSYNFLSHWSVLVLCIYYFLFVNSVFIIAFFTSSHLSFLLGLL
jgi:hypothetical protein